MWSFVDLLSSPTQPGLLRSILSQWEVPRNGLPKAFTDILHGNGQESLVSTPH